MLNLPEIVGVSIAGVDIGFIALVVLAGVGLSIIANILTPDIKDEKT